MAKGIGTWTRTETKIGLRVDPKVVLTSQILQMSQQELDQSIDSELNDNPALERLQDDWDPLSDETILKSVAPQELRYDTDDYEYQRSAPHDGDGVDWMDLTATTTSLWEHLQAQMFNRVPRWLEDLAIYVVQCVNDKGYLTLPPEEIALATGHALEDVELVVEKLRECEPAGVGAYEIQECLLLQLRDAQTLEQRIARAILRHHMEDFLARKIARLARRFRVMPEVIEAAIEEIKSLTPFPGEAFATYENRRGDRRIPAISPDILLIYTESGWSVEVKGADPGSLAINRSYRRRYEQLREAVNSAKDERQHVTQYVRRAASFIQSIHQRRRTLRRIGEYLIQQQSGFVSTGEYRFLRALTRTQLARDLGMHESTVSRATMGKFVQIANGEVVSFEVFFKPALRVQKMIEEILQTENPANPLSDEAIAQQLEQRGVKVARRTVNKYRDKTRLLSSRKRRSA